MWTRPRRVDCFSNLGFSARLRFALAAETLKLERTPSALVSQAYGLTPAEIDLKLIFDSLKS